ncbi:MAG: methyltransferase [Mycobacteriaceae bacterium]|nr:methyltransferase [Mycobacteriaceae bacterium]
MSDTDLEIKAPPEYLAELMYSVFVARAVHVFADLGIADRLADGPLSSSRLAADADVQAVPLHQVLRAVASLGLLQSVPGSESGPEQRWELTADGSCLREGHPSAMLDMVRTLQGPTAWGCLSVLSQRVATGRTGPEIAFGQTYFDRLLESPEEKAAHNNTMIAAHGSEPAAIAGTYEFDRATQVADIGGGIGTLLSTILARHTHLTGVLLEQPSVIGQAETVVANAGVAERCELVGGDFFQTVPAGADVYILSHILHDWDDDSCLRILRRCAEAMTPRSRLLIVEMVLPDTDEPHVGKVLDMVMLTLVSGMERTREGYRQLLDAAGLRVRRTIAVDASPISIVEAALGAAPTD